MTSAPTVAIAILLCACNRSASEPAPTDVPVAVEAAPEATTPEATASESKAPAAKTADAKPMPDLAPSDVLRSGTPRDGRIEVQIVDLTADEAKAIDEVLGDTGSIARDDPRMPARWRMGRPFSVWTGDTVHGATLVGFESGSGGSGTIYTMTLEAKGVGDRGGWVTDVGGPKIGAGKGKGADADAAKRAIPAVRRLLKEGGLRGKVSAKHVRAVRGAFPAPHTTAIAVSIDTGGSDPTGGYTSGLVLTDDAGNVTGAAYELDERLDRFEIDQLLDLGDDGIDELVFTTSYYEGDYTHLLRWNGPTPEIVVIEGDGA
jgi:hypothetical protein